MTPEARLPAMLAMVVCGIALGVALGWAFHGSVPASATLPPVTTATRPPAPAPAPVPAPTGTPNPEAKARAALGSALADATSAAAGEMQAAVMLDTWTRPVARGDRLPRAMRVWSMVKAVTAVTLLERVGAAKQAVPEPYLERALRRSENCPQRKLTLELQEAAGGLEPAREAIRETMQRAGAAMNVGIAQTARGEPACLKASYPGHLASSDIAAQALQLGTAEWHVSDAVRFMHALRGDVYDKRPTDRVLEILRSPKQRSEEPGTDSDFSAPIAWGAGSVFRKACWRVAYKAGWGGSKHGNFLAGQMGTVELGGGRWAAFAVMVHPPTQPPVDDPGKVGADKAVASALDALKSALVAQYGGCS